MLKKTNIFLFIILSILGLVVLNLQNETETVSRTLLTIDPSQIQTIHIETPENRIFLLKVDKHWKIDLGMNNARKLLHADKWRIEQLLSLTQQADFELVNSVDYHKFGLATPHASVQFNDIKVIYGNNHDISRRRYIQIGQQIFLIRDKIYRHLIEETSQYLSKSLIPPDVEIGAILTPTISVIRNNQHWQAIPPMLSTDMLQIFLNEWRLATAHRVEFGNAPATAEVVQIDLQDDQQITYNVQRTEENTIFSRSDIKLHYFISQQTAAKLISIDQ